MQGFLVFSWGDPFVFLEYPDKADIAGITDGTGDVRNRILASRIISLERSIRILAR